MPCQICQNHAELIEANELIELSQRWTFGAVRRAVRLPKPRLASSRWQNPEEPNGRGQRAITHRHERAQNTLNTLNWSGYVWSVLLVIDVIDLDPATLVLWQLWQLVLVLDQYVDFFCFANWLSLGPVWYIPHGTVTVGKRDFVGFRVSKSAHIDECNACIRIQLPVYFILNAARTPLRDMWQLGLCFINLWIYWLFVICKLDFHISRLVRSAAWICHSWKKILSRI